MSWTRRITHPSELLKKGQTVKCMVLNVDQEKSRVGLGLKQLTEDPWERAIPEKYVPGQIVQGKVVKITTFGVFLELEPELEGLLHISELAEDKVENPNDLLSMDQELEVKILRVDIEDRKIGLSLKRVRWSEEDADQNGEQSTSSAPTNKRLRGGLHGAGGDLGSDLISYSVLGGASQAEQPSSDEQPAAELSQPEDSASPEESPQPPEPQNKPADNDASEQKDESDKSSE